MLITHPDLNIWGVPGEVFYDGVHGFQRTDYNVRCAFGGDPSKPCTLQMSTPDNGIFLLTGINRDQCCLLFDGLGAPPPDWVSNMVYNSTTYAWGQQNAEIWIGGGHAYFIAPVSQDPVMVLPENWVWQTSFIQQEFPSTIFKLPSSCSSRTFCPGFQPSNDTRQLVLPFPW